MPEAPDLYVLQRFLEPRIVGMTITEAQELRPLVLRNMTGTPFSDHIQGRTIESLERKGKLITLHMSDDASLVISPMLAGEIRLSKPSQPTLKSTIIKLDLEDEAQLRYIDPKRMGQLYYIPTDRMNEIARIENQGPDVIDEPYTLRRFEEAMKPYRGEIKGVLTRGNLISGIGNAYADEILWHAGIFPFKKATRLDREELARLHEAITVVPQKAVAALQDIFKRQERDPHKERSFLRVHGKAGEPCPRCGSAIGSVKAKRRETNFCRSCQPGSMFE